MKDNRTLIIKALLSIAFIIIIFSSISRLFYANSDTLAEHAAKNPPPVYTPTASPPDQKKDNPETHPEETENPDNNLSVSAPSPEPTEEPSMQAIKQFYYAPLTNEQKTYITGCSYPDTDANLAITYDDLRYVHILHYDFDGNIAEGKLICNEYIANDLIEIFYELYLNEYQLERVTLIENYNGDDELSMADNNTSCFNYRVVAGSNKLSKHAYGLAVDINPLYNPYITYPNGTVNIAPAGSEAYADRTASFPYKIDEQDLCYKLFIDHGFTWGGAWNSSKDYQHFQKSMN